MSAVNGINYRQEPGSGQPIVFIHGWLGSNQSWKLVEKNLDLENPMIFIDLRCHGNSACKMFSMKTLAEDLGRVIEHSCSEKPVIVGHSMGGMTALTYSCISDYYRGLCLLGTCASTPEPKIKSPRFFLEQFEELDREEWAKMITKNYLAESKKKELKESTEQELREADKKPVKYGLKAMIDYEIRDELDVEKESLVVAGEKDGAIKMDKSEELAKIIGCELKTIDSGHIMLHEAPKKIAEIIEEFCAQL